MDIDSSDEATGLPPLQEGPAGVQATLRTCADASFLPVRGASGGEGLVRVPGHDEVLAVRYVHLRGLIYDPENTQDAKWMQTTLAVPADLMPGLMAVLETA